jgi:hypothetical protein
MDVLNYYYLYDRYQEFYYLHCPEKRFLNPNSLRKKYYEQEHLDPKEYQHLDPKEE